MATHYTNHYLTQNVLIINQPIYFTPCRYYSTYTGCMYGNSCLFQHIDYTYSPQINRLHHNTNQMFPNNSSISYDACISPSLPSPSPIPSSNSQSDIAIDTSDTNQLKQANAKKKSEPITWDGCAKTIGYGSRKNMAIKTFESSIKQTNKNNLQCKVDATDTFALLVSNCADNKLNGLYLRSGYRNGCAKYTECINNLSTIYCNPKRGWTISCNNAVYYYSYPLTDTPPTINNSNSNWLCNFDGNDRSLPYIKSSFITGHCLLDLLFVGFVRNKNELKTCWYMVSADIIKIFYGYFMQHKHDRCANCLRKCENVVLCGFQWLCMDCNREMF